MSETQQGAVLSANDVGYVWESLHQSNRALEHITVEFRSGISNFICGPSGAGKSTLGLLLSGLIPPSEGRITLNGRDLVSQRDRIACVFQFPETLFFADTVREELTEIRGNADIEPCSAYFEQLGISFAGIQDRHPHLLSEGYARLTAIALQMSRNPELFILDEPTIGLDWKHQERVIATLKSWVNSSRILIIITHDLDLLSALGGRTYLMHSG